MATNVPQPDLGRVGLTKVHLEALEAALYQAADAINRLKREGEPYTKLQVQGGQ